VKPAAWLGTGSRDGRRTGRFSMQCLLGHLESRPGHAVCFKTLQGDNISTYTFLYISRLSAGSPTKPLSTPERFVSRTGYSGHDAVPLWRAHPSCPSNAITGDGQTAEEHEIPHSSHDLAFVPLPFPRHKCFYMAPPRPSS